MTPEPQEARGGSTSPRPLQELTLTVLALTLLVVFTAVGFRVVKAILDRGQNQRVLNRVVELTENSLRLNRLNWPETLLLRTMSMGHDIQRQEAWTFIEYLPGMPIFGLTLIESLSQRSDDPANRILLADLRFRRDGPVAALAIFE